MLELRDVKFSVNDENGSVKNIINGISMNIDESKFVAITGPNGSGKSTLAKLIVGINQPTEGRILYNGTDITNMSITERAKLGISFAFQQPVRFKGITVIDLLRIAAGKQLTISEACEYLSEVGLCARDYINREVDASLSGGELKRIEIATIIARGTELSVFDEPEAG
ncbi:MAG: ATP-binding cassette domain-containing protein, partial [Eubacterium sp.]|nr:ATP-binding cassette domain-containing protein [Eubacterium sp.]